MFKSCHGHPGVSPGLGPSDPRRLRGRLSSSPVHAEAGRGAVALAKVVTAPCVMCLVSVVRPPGLSPAQVATFDAVLGSPAPIGLLVKRVAHGTLGAVGRIRLRRRHGSGGPRTP